MGKKYLIWALVYNFQKAQFEIQLKSIAVHLYLHSITDKWDPEICAWCCFSAWANAFCFTFTDPLPRGCCLLAPAGQPPAPLMELHRGLPSCPWTDLGTRHSLWLGVLVDSPQPPGPPGAQWSPRQLQKIKANGHLPLSPQTKFLARQSPFQYLIFGPRCWDCKIYCSHWLWLFLFWFGGVRSNSWAFTAVWHTAWFSGVPQTHLFLNHWSYGFEPCIKRLNSECGPSFIIDKIGQKHWRWIVWIRPSFYWTFIVLLDLPKYNRHFHTRIFSNWSYFHQVTC